jgi:transcription factor C subunit 7
VPSVNGESIPMLHDRLAYALHHLIGRADADPNGPKAILLCTHAAAIIAIGRALTGVMPDDVGEEDFKCFTCGVSTFKRKRAEEEAKMDVREWDQSMPEDIPDLGWRGGKGVQGGWTCEANSDCSFLDGGEERGW